MTGLINAIRLLFLIRGKCKTDPPKKGRKIVKIRFKILRSRPHAKPTGLFGTGSLKKDKSGFSAGNR